MTTALILVDYQNDFMPSGALPVAEGDAIIQPTNALLARTPYDWVIATQDWHPSNHQSFAIHHNKEPFSQGYVGGIEQTLWPVHCVQHTYGADFHPNLHRNFFHTIIQKGMNPDIDSYSAFFDNARKQHTALKAFCQEKGITHLDVAGLAADFCVYFTLCDALEEGFHVRLLEDLTRAINHDEWQKKRQKLLTHPHFSLIFSKNV